MSEKRPVSPINGVPLPVGKPFEKGEEQRERAKKAGKRSAEVRRARKTLREELLELLKVEIKDKDGNKSGNTQKAISSALIKQAMMGNTRAFEIIRDTIGEKPAENVNIVTSDFSALDSAFEGLSGGDTD